MDRSNDITKHGQAIDRAFLFSRLQEKHTLLLESSRQDDIDHQNLLFHSPISILTALTQAEIPSLFTALEEHLKNGRWIAGYVSYEAGYHFVEQRSPAPGPEPLPLIWFGVYEHPHHIPASLLNSAEGEAPASINDPRLSIPQSDYEKIIGRLKEYIVNGDTYQVNFTDRFEFDTTGDASSLYFGLRKKQHVPFGAFINLGESQILSFSPELFFRRDGRSIVTKPMKGTCPRGKTNAEDTALSEWLRSDEKNRSENLMIVDLLRNDIGRICTNGSIHVREMYSVERYETVLQMTSTVAGTLRSGISYYDIFSSLFPCGSVTGAPKIRTMQIIRETERHPRGVYCGAIGFISPENQSVFNVAIRTLELNGSKVSMGVGSGIVYDSVPQNEYEECRLKAAFLLNRHEEFQLLETILWNNSFSFLKEHLDRMQDSASYWNIPFDRERITELLQLTERALQIGKEYRIRLMTAADGTPTVEVSELSVGVHSFAVRIASDRVHSGDRFLYHKTTRRAQYDRYQKKALDERIADYLFLNERGEVTEGSISNLFIEKNGALYTPPVSCGVLPGIYRGHVLRTEPKALEKVLSIDDLRTADALLLCNSVRGWRKVTLSE